MIQSKDFLLRLMKDLSGMLNKLIGSYPDNTLGMSEADIEQQVYTATGLTTEHFLQLDENALNAAINENGVENRTLVLDFLGNLFYHQYQVTGDKELLEKSKRMYNLFQEESGTFSMVYFQRTQQV
ncbi:MAG TPA: hypothetical protein VL053_11345 [Arachidicoccus sp.]|nr:hypothetical protein [Arachidicoccus sp.]